jgi:hypothetical protein
VRRARARGYIKSRLVVGFKNGIRHVLPDDRTAVSARVKITHSTVTVSEWLTVKGRPACEGMCWPMGGGGTSAVGKVL